MEDENARNTQEIPSLESELSRLQTQLAEAQRKTRVLTCYKQADPESTVSLKKNENEGLSPSLLIAIKFASVNLTMCLCSQNALSTKAIVAKLSGFAKFELDLKLNADQFCLLVNNFSASEGRFSEEKFNEIVEAFEKTFGEGATPPFAGDLENETYKSILTTIREYSSSEISNK